MATNRTVKIEELQVGDKVMIQGVLGFSHWLTRILDGDDLRKRNEGQKFPNLTPHCEGQLLDAVVVCADPAAPTKAETYAHERVYANKDGRQCYSLEKKKVLPRFGYRKPDGKIQEVDLAEKNLGEGNKVTCYYSVFESKTYKKNGFGLDAIIFDEEPKFYEGSSLPGGEWDTLPRENTQTEPAAQPAQPAAPAQAPQPAPAPAANGFVAAGADNPWGATEAAAPTNPWG